MLRQVGAVLMDLRGRSTTLGRVRIGTPCLIKASIHLNVDQAGPWSSGKRQCLNFNSSSHCVFQYDSPLGNVAA